MTKTAFKIDMTKHTHRARMNPDNESSRGNVHPNSLLAKTIDDPELKKKFEAWEREYKERYKQMEFWKECGFFAR